MLNDLIIARAYACPVRIDLVRAGERACRRGRVYAWIHRTLHRLTGW